MFFFSASLITCWNEVIFISATQGCPEDDGAQRLSLKWIVCSTVTGSWHALLRLSGYFTSLSLSSSAILRRNLCHITVSVGTSPVCNCSERVQWNLSYDLLQVIRICHLPLHYPSIKDVDLKYCCHAEQAKLGCRAAPCYSELYRGSALTSVRLQWRALRLWVSASSVLLTAHHVLHRFNQCSFSGSYDRSVCRCVCAVTSQDML